MDMMNYLQPKSFDDARDPFAIAVGAIEGFVASISVSGINCNFAIKPAQTMEDIVIKFDFGLNGQFWSEEYSAALFQSVSKAQVLAKISKNRFSQSERNNDLLIAKFIPVSAREILKKEGWQYLDLAGNCYFRSSQIPLLVQRDVTQTNPWKEDGRPAQNLSGSSASRITRTLLTSELPIKIADLIQKSGASRGTTYRVLDYLSNMGLVSKGSNSNIETCEKYELLELWGSDYRINERGATRKFVDPRGVSNFLGNLVQSSEKYVVTGSVAGNSYLSFTEDRVATVYVNDFEAIVRDLGLIETTENPNVILIQPKDDGVFAGAVKFRNLNVVAAPQAYVDLIKGNGRNPDLAGALISWMKAVEIG